MERLRRLVSRIRPWMLVVAGVGVLALWLRLHALGRESLWLDEGQGWQRARKPIPELVKDAIDAQHSPTYFVLLHYWIELGDDEFMLRFPSVVGGTLAAMATAALGCILAGPAAGVAAGALLAFAPVHVHYAQEASMYALLSASTAIAITALFWFGMHPEHAARPILGIQHIPLPRFLRRGQPAADGGSEPAALPRVGTGATLAWAAYIAGMIASLYLHFAAAVFAATIGLTALVLLGRPFPLRLRFLANFFAANLVVLVAWAPFSRTLAAQVERFSSSDLGATYPTRDQVAASFRELFLLTGDWPSLLTILLLAAAVSGLVALRSFPEVAIASVVLALLGPGLMLLVSLHAPLFGTRTLLWVTPPFFALVGAGLTLRAPWLTAVAFLAVAGYLVEPRLSREYERLTNEAWREVAWTIRSRVVPGARILTITQAEQTMLGYYMNRRSHPLLQVPLEVAEKRKAWRQIRGAPRLWLVDRKGARRRARWELTQRAQTSWDRYWNRRLRVTQFEFSRR